MRKIAKSAVGFYLWQGLKPEAKARGLSKFKKALDHLPWLKYSQLKHGVTELGLWGHHSLENSVYYDDAKNLYALIGSQFNEVDWEDVIRQLAREGDDKFVLPWEGRCLLIRVSSDGHDWTIWNDWTGCVPVFHTQVDGANIASILEPVVVAAAEFTPQDFSKRGIVELLIHAQFLDTDTLYSKMHTIISDSVSRWSHDKFLGSKRFWSIRPSEKRWNVKWDDLVDEMYTHTIRVIKAAFSNHKKCILTLSGGMDSRLIAAVLKEMGMDVKSYTYGAVGWNETMYAQRVAESLNIPWKRIDLGTHFLADYTQTWFDIFGASMHAHGMYQISFLNSVKNEEGVVPDGWFGNNLAGGNHPSTIFLAEKGQAWYGFYKGYMMLWSIEELEKLLKFDVKPVIDEMIELIDKQMKLVKDWPAYHQKNAVDMWNRQQRLVFYQQMIYDHWKGNVTPFMDREYAKFCMSLPIEALNIRKMQIAMLKRYWPKLGEIPGTYEEVNFSNRYYFMAKDLAMKYLPWNFLVGFVKKLGKVANTLEVDCLRETQWKALSPVHPEFNGLNLFDSDVVVKTAQKALKYSVNDYMKISAIQPIYYRMQNQ